MTFSIFDSGNLVRSFEDESEIWKAFERLAAEAPDSERDRYRLFAFDSVGNVIFDCAPRTHPTDRLAPTAGAAAPPETTKSRARGARAVPLARAA